MKVRELLQIELWSKRTSWKICLGFAGFVVAGLICGYAAERFWITPGVLKESRIALEGIDQLQNSDSLSDQDFGASARQVEKEIDVALGKARTDRDVGVTFQLSKYLHSVLMERLQVRKEKELEKKQDPQAKQSQAWHERLHLSEVKLRSELHKELDLRKLRF
jgi:hypothetical protein